MPRIALGIEYDGSGFAGWQSQIEAVGVQSVVEKALSVVANEPIEVVAAGRTDAGVHASMQVVHFDTVAVRDERSWMRGSAANLPKQVSCCGREKLLKGFMRATRRRRGVIAMSS